MLIVIENLLTQDEVQALRRRLLIDGEADWVDGRATAGHQGAKVKRNRQIAEGSATAREAGAFVLSKLETHPTFISAVLPNRVYPPLFNRYAAGETFGWHVDGAVRLDPRDGAKMRTDVSSTLFLSDPEDYEGGELEIADTYGVHGVRLSAGDLVVYPASSLHQVTPVTRGERLAAFFWTESLIRDDARRTLLYEMDEAIQTLNAEGADAAARRTLGGVYHNLLRQWAQS